MANLFDWNLIWAKTDEIAEISNCIRYLENLLLSVADGQFFELLSRELSAQTHYMDSKQKEIWITYKYLQCLLSKDVEAFSKEINLQKLIADLTLKRYQEEKFITSHKKYTTAQKDILLEDLEKRSERELETLKVTYQAKYNAWADQNRAQLQEYALVKTRIEAWYKAHFNSVKSCES